MKKPLTKDLRSTWTTERDHKEAIKAFAVAMEGLEAYQLSQLFGQPVYRTLRRETSFLSMTERD